MDKQKQIIEMFDEIAPSYDATNRILSMGIDIAWRKEACKKSFEYINSNNIGVILDVACGTGDMIEHWSKNAKKYQKTFKKIIGIDPSEGMLKIAREKLKDSEYFEKIEIIKSQAQDLSLIPSNSIDILSIAYGLRNVVEITQALKEFARVLKNEGVLVILEFTKKEKQTFLGKMMSFYTKKALPIIGGLVSKNYNAYRYLPDSIEGFLSVEALKKELLKVNVETKFTKGYSADVSTLLIGVKRDEC